MSVSSKIKALLNLTEKNSAGLAAHLKINQQSLRNKFNRNSFSADDLIKAAEFCGVELSYKIDDKQKIVLDANDAREKAEDV